MVLGIVRGWEYLPLEARRLTKDLSGKDLSSYSARALKKFRSQCGLGYQLLYCKSIDAYVCKNRRGNRVRFDEDPHVNSEFSYWTMSWDGLIENEATGEQKYFTRPYFSPSHGRILFLESSSFPN